MDNDRKRQISFQYKSKRLIGGICRISCTAGGEWLMSSVDIEGLKNRFAFARATGSCVLPAMRAQWEKYGKDAFSFEVLETLEQSEGQSREDFARDIAQLETISKETSG